MKCEYCINGKNPGIKIFNSKGELKIMKYNIIIKTKKQDFGNTCNKCKQNKDICSNCLHQVQITNNKILCLQCDESIKKERIETIDKWLN